METSKFLSLIEEIIDKNISDLHLSTARAPFIRNQTGEIVEVESFGALSAEDIENVIAMLYGKPFTKTSVDVSFEHKNVRFRVNIFRTIHGITISMRRILSVIPDPKDILLPEYILDIANTGKGLILVTGPTGSGKSTTLATIAQHINKTLRKHIITLEDPVEFVYKNEKCLINQREYGRHFETFDGGIRSVLREDPDIVIVGEMRDLETIQAAIELAESGHLVLSTLHTNDTVQTVDRIIQSFPKETQNQIRMQLSLTLKMVVSQVLIPKADHSGRVVAREILVNNDSVRNLILRGQTQHIYSTVETASQEGMILMDQSIKNLFKEGLISEYDALYSMRDRDRLYSD
ncbi:PilT/PilU family type 4a pilus ATPase [Candidatus Gracilibacteria bacterium]|nr:PilT/PilU family type 4a pilus ATPase [Candidatus Gracilibacteria bacterium]